MLGAIAPGVWIYEVLYGHDYVGSPNSILDQLVPFFPCSILFLAIPYPMNLPGIIVIAIAALLNMGLYALGAYVVLSLLRVAILIGGKKSN
jgi:hypothetical protein